VPSGVTHGGGTYTYTGNLMLPPVSTLASGARFGSNGTQHTRTLAGGSGGVRFFVVPAAKEKPHL